MTRRRNLGNAHTIDLAWARLIRRQRIAAKRSAVRAALWGLIAASAGLLAYQLSSL